MARFIGNFLTLFPEVLPVQLEWDENGRLGDKYKVYYNRMKY